MNKLRLITVTASKLEMHDLLGWQNSHVLDLGSSLALTTLVLWCFSLPLSKEKGMHGLTFHTSFPAHSLKPVPMQPIWLTWEAGGDMVHSAKSQVGVTCSSH